MKNRLFLILNIITCCFLLSGCNTLHGLGKDIKATGEQLENITGGSN